jgi:hypothetical protein
MNARRCSLVVVLAAMVCSMFALTASPALAFEERLLLGHFDGEGGGAQKFGDPNGMAVDEANGVVYVADLAHDVVDKFNLKGEPLNFGVTGNNALSGSPSPAGSFAFPNASPEDTPAALAVDNAPLSPSRGDLYVLDAGHGVIDKFAPSGEYLGQLKETPGGPFNREGTFGGPYGVATDTSGDVWVFEPNATIDEFSPIGVFDSSYTTECQSPNPGFAINSVHDAFISCQGVFEEVAPGGTHLASVPQSGVTAITVDLGNDHIVAAREATTAFEYDSALTPLEGFLIEGNPGGAAGGLALDSSSGDLYMSNPVTGLVYHWGAVLTLPDVETGEEVSNVQTTTATAAGTVNPDGIKVTACEFEYGTTTEYGKKASCSTEPGSGSSTVPVTAVLEQLEPDTLYHYRLTASNAEGTNPGGDQTFTTAGVPTVDEESASAVSQTTATIEAEINPHRFDTTYHFEYGESKAYGTSIPIPDEDIGSGSIDQRVSAEIPGLRSGVTYHYRVVATNSQGVTDGFDKSLSTVPPAEISAVSASNVSSESATLNATIDPLGRDTTYQFEYGTSSAYGRVAPAALVDIGAGTSAVEVSQAIPVQPNTPYHFRVIAKNGLGTASSSDHVFVYDTAAESLPDGRAYEMVTPPQKNGARIGESFLTLAPSIARSGSRAILPSIQCFGDTQACNGIRGVIPGGSYAFTRTPEGWSGVGLSPSAAQFDGVTSAPYRTNADLDTALFSLPPAAGREDHWYRRTESGAVEDIGPITPPEGGAQGPPRQLYSGIAATADLSHVLYTLSRLENKAFELWPFDSTIKGTTSLYEYSGSAQQAPELVAVSGGPGSMSLVSTCGAKLGSEGAGFNVMSADGETVFFMALSHPEQSNEPCVGPPANEMYARIGRSETVPISRRSPVGCTSDACLKSPPANAAFQGASEDGKRALFTSTQQLTDSASEDSTPEADGGGGRCFATIGRNGCNLYMYDFEASAGENLIDVSAGDTSGLGPRVKGVVAVSSDASHVYFVAGGVLTQTPNGQGEEAVPGADNLYLYEPNAKHPGGHTVYIATLSPTDEQEWGNGSPGEPANVTPDGRVLVFLSHAALTADDTRPEGPAQVYRYDAESGQLVRVSIGAHGFNDDGNSGTGDANIVSPHQVGDIVAGPSQPDPTMSDDGAYVFFESPVGLTRGALNDVVIGSNPNGSPSHAMNIYEYHDREVSLISDGRDTSIFERQSSTSGESLSGVLLLGSDASGANVFFITADQLVPADTDTQFDVYDARIGGGFPAPVSPASCQGEACHGIPAATPSLLAPGTVTFSGAGNLTPTITAKSKPKAKSARCREGFVRRHGRCVRAKTKKKSQRKRAKAKKASNAGNDRRAK